MRTAPVLASVLAGTMVATSAAAAEPAPDKSRTTPQFCSVQIDIASTLPGGKHEDPDVKRVNAEIDKIFAAALKKAQNAAALNPYHQLTLLGTLGLYDKTLSVDKNLACTSCHNLDAGFTGGVSLWNQTIVANPGSVPDTKAKPPAPNYRIAARKPQTYGYAPFAPRLRYNAEQQEFVGGNFWDMRATGFVTGNPAGDQAEGPPLNPLEMGLPDSACVVYRLSQSAYERLFERVWGAQSFAITWPANVEEVCAKPGPAPANDPLPVHLGASDRKTSNTAYARLVVSMAAYEATPDVSPFSSKLDYATAHPKEHVLTDEELAGEKLFRGKGKCDTCHLTPSNLAAKSIPTPGPSIDPRHLFKSQERGQVFTDFQDHNIGIPANYTLPYYCETKPDQYGFVANPLGKKYVDEGVGGFLAGPSDPNPQWKKLAPEHDGRFRTPTVRNVDKRPRPDFVKAYMHNGFLKSLKEVVHFYNTRDVLPRCKDPLDPQAGTKCWPAPEVTANLDKTIGDLGLSSQEEDAVVAFLRTLTDGYKHTAAAGDAAGGSDGGGSPAPAP